MESVAQLYDMSAPCHSFSMAPVRKVNGRTFVNRTYETNFSFLFPFRAFEPASLTQPIRVRFATWKGGYRRGRSFLVVPTARDTVDWWTLQAVAEEDRSTPKIRVSPKSQITKSGFADFLHSPKKGSGANPHTRTFELLVSSKRRSTGQQRGQWVSKKRPPSPRCGT